MNEIGSLVNILAIGGLFLYQRYRLRLLDEAMRAQRRLVEETKSVVSQQATAMESQARVVETAMNYSQAFDPKKLEGIIRREIAIDFAQEKARLEEKVSVLQQSQAEIIELVVAKTVEYTMDLVSPAFYGYLRVLMTFEASERDAIIARIENDRSRQFMSGIVATMASSLPPASGTSGAA